ncbi:unnamed protein product, partial [marine sediment metagenome]
QNKTSTKNFHPRERKKSKGRTIHSDFWALQKSEWITRRAG